MHMPQTNYFHIKIWIFGFDRLIPKAAISLRYNTHKQKSKNQKLQQTSYMCKQDQRTNKR